MTLTVVLNPVELAARRMRLTTVSTVSNSMPLQARPRRKVMVKRLEWFAAANAALAVQLPEVLLRLGVD
jgi:hypothetical protein